MQPWKHLNSNLKYMINNLLLWSFRLLSTISILTGHHFLLISTLLLRIGCLGRDLELICFSFSKIYEFICIFALILLLLSLVLILDLYFDLVLLLISNFKNRVEYFDEYLYFYLIDLNFPQKYLFVVYTKNLHQNIKYFFLIIF